MATLVLTSCADEPVDESLVPAAEPAAAGPATLLHPSTQTLDALVIEVAPLELVFSHSVVPFEGERGKQWPILPAGTELDKYTFALGGVRVEGAGVRVLRDAAGGSRVVRALALAPAARAALRAPRISAAQADAIALDHAARRPGRLRTELPLARHRSLVFVARMHDDPAGGAQVIDALRLTYQVEVSDAPDALVADQLAIVDAATGDLVELRSGLLHATATGQGYFEANTTLQVEPTSAGTWCLTDLTRGDAVTNANPCGPAVGPGLHTYIELPNPERVERVTDTDTTFGNTIFPFDRAHAAGEPGRTVAADAHHSIEVAYDFYRTVYGRRILGTNDSIELHVNSSNLIWNAAFSFPSTIVVGDRQLNGPQCPATNSDCSVPAADVEWLTHEYTHAVLAGELSMPPGGVEFAALHEGISDVFAVLADGWWYQAPGTQSLPLPRNWIFADRIFPRPQGRLFDKPSLDGAGSLDFWTVAVPINLANGTLGAHTAGGIVRRAFFFLALGIAPSAPGAPLPLPNNVTPLVPNGLTGVGIDAAALILYFAIATQFDPGAAPTFAEMREGMVREATFLHGRCTPVAKAVADAWAGVGVGAVADRTGPSLSLTVSQVGAGAQVVGHAIVPVGEGAPRASLWIDGVLRQDLVPVALASTSGGQADYLVTPAEVSLATLAAGSHTFELRGQDDCQNGSAALTTLVGDSAPPAALSLTDTNQFRSSLRVFRVTAVDATLATYELRVGTVTSGVRAVTGNLHALDTTVSLDLTSLPAGQAATTLTVRDSGGRWTTLNGTLLVDRDEPSSCNIAATISPSEPQAIVATLWGSNAGFKSTQIEILDIWFDGAPFYWTDRNYPVESPRFMTPQPFGGGTMTKTISNVANGRHKLLGKCFDSWGNWAGAKTSFVMVSPPTVTATAIVQTGAFTVSATATSTAVNINRIEFYEQNLLVGTTACGNVSLTCSAARQFPASPGQFRKVRVSGYDQAGRRTDKLVSVTMPLPPPPVISNIVKSGPARFPTLTVTTSNVSRVELVIAGVVVSNDTSLPFAFPLDLGGWATGTHALELRAHDDFGRIVSSTYSIFADSTPPVLAVTVQGGQPPYLVGASVLDHSPYFVNFKVDGVTFATANSTPYQAYYTPTSPGAHTLSVEAVDVFFNSTVVDVSAPDDHTGPTVTLSFETSGGPHEFVALDDGCGIEYPAQLYLDGVPVASISTPTYTHPWTNLAYGHHVAAIDVTDRCGNQTFIEAPFDHGDEPPVVHSISVDSTMPKKPRLTIDATDDIAVSRIDILRGSTLVATVTSAPWTVQLDSMTWPDGNHTISARAYDDSDQTDQQSVTIKADNTAPVLNLTAQHLGLGTIRWTAAATDALSPVSDVAMGASFNNVPIQHFSAPPYQIITTVPASGTQYDVWTTVSATDSFGNQVGISRISAVHCTGTGSSRVCTAGPLTPGP